MNLNYLHTPSHLCGCMNMAIFKCLVCVKGSEIILCTHIPLCIFWLGNSTQLCYIFWSDCKICLGQRLSLTGSIISVSAWKLHFNIYCSDSQNMASLAFQEGGESSMCTSQHLIILTRLAQLRLHKATHRGIFLNAKDAFPVTRNVHRAMGMRVWEW